MFELKSQSVSRWKIDSQNYPYVINVRCPSCGTLVGFSCDKWHPGPFNVKLSRTECPSCQSHSTFYLTNHTGKSPALSKGERLFIEKAPQERIPNSYILESENLSESLRAAYQSAVNVYNVGEWNGTAVLTRRLLEGITKSLVPKEMQSKPLAKQVKELSSAIDLTQPITQIADAIREGGNLGAHFDLEKEPDRETAELMLELVEELIEYVYVLPNRIDELKGNIGNLKNEI